MGCTVAELLDRISARELSEWLAYEQLEPFGPRATNLNFGLIASSVLNCHLKKSSDTIRPEQMALGDFDERKHPEEKVQSVEQQKHVLLNIARIFGAKDNRKKK